MRHTSSQFAWDAKLHPRIRTHGREDVDSAGRRMTSQRMSADQVFTSPTINSRGCNVICRLGMGP
jgi:phosphohistidine phosphatase SixA